jgi:NADPH-dependent 2,4-dienoyl-CoA reductase/sulfur reductase-like enzyme
VDEISISAGSKEELGSPCASAAFAEGFRADDSAVLKGAVKIPVGVVGRIMTPEAADQIIKDGKADLVYVGRALIADPELPKKAKEGRREEIRPCIVCNRGCIDRLRANLDVRCAVNAALGQEKPNAPRTAQPRKVLIVGGGPAGLEAARMAAWRGHRVTLYEASHQLGGKLNSVIRSNHKEPVARLIQYYTRQMEMLNVDMELGAEVTPDIITTFRPDVLIVAVGALPLQLELPGIHLPHVRSAEECLRDRASLGHKVAIVGGGMVGIEVADVLVESGREVTIVEQLESITDKMGSLMEDLTLRLCSKGVHIYVNTRVRAVTHQGLIVERLGKSEALAVENIVIAAGYRPHLDIMKGIDVTGIEYHEIGDCVQPRTILEAVAEGYRAGSAI